MRRREFLKLAGATALAPAAIGVASSASARPDARVRPAHPATYFVPGNTQADIFMDGVPILEHPVLARQMRTMKGTGRPVFLSRFSETDGSVTRTVLPVAAHAIAIRPDAESAVCTPQGGSTLVTFDPESLEMGAFVEYADGLEGGGHAVYLPDGKTMAVSERIPFSPYTGNPKDHYGRLSIRDNESLGELGEIPCGGISPHDLELLEDGKNIAVANYGATKWPTDQIGYDRYRVEPSVAVVEVASGKVVERYAPDSHDGEFRHIAALRLDRIFVLQNAEDSLAHYHQLKSQETGLYRPKLKNTPHTVGASLPMMRVDFTADPPVTMLEANSPGEMMRGQSIAYDPVHDEAIATFPLSDCVVAFDAANGSLKRVVRTDRLGL